ncbi:rho GTPase-activating protein 190 isoform X2 [Cimex lectularius]|uniref:Rho GTPase-activating protein 190 n=1 Tax=Cimex lectularius TaxID=79782 RepID=A0A8I6TFR7_CIMLE|nr:rho GTPase-activating protein 190 isoform X2 [Cimex lectularius]
MMTMMSRRGDSGKWFHVSVVGLSGTEKEKGAVGVGKSCLCNRFLRTNADDYSADHISVLSQSDFSGRVVNNDHFLYWGEVTKTSDEGTEYQFQVVEQTEFIDDSSFQAFKGGKMEPYVKRCAATKLTSAEKLMYICKNQLGIEKEYEQKVLPDGKVNIDGFLCVFDVSVIPNRTLEKQIETVGAILNNLIKTKKPVVVVTTKNDDGSEVYAREVEKLVARKEYKGLIPIVETSAHENINVDLAFFTLALLIDRNRSRIKIVPYAEAARLRKEHLDITTEAFQSLIRSQITDHQSLWSQTYKKFAKHDELLKFTQEFGSANTQRIFRRHVKKLKDEHFAKKVQSYMDLLPDILQEMVPDMSMFHECDWSTVQKHIKDHPDFNNYFYNCEKDVTWSEGDWEGTCTKERRIPCDILETGEAENVFKSHASALQQEQKKMEWKKQFKQLLEDTGYVTPGKSLSEIRVLFMGRECFEALSEQDCQMIYDRHQKDIVDKAKHNFQELLLENADLFYHFKSIAPTGTITQDDIKEITDALKDDSRYKALDRLDQDRKLMLFQHLGFVHCPIREHCPAFPNCMDALIERILSNKVHRPSWNQTGWGISGNQLNLVILGIKGLAHEFASEIRVLCEDDDIEIDYCLYSIELRVIEGDVNLPQNSFKSSEFQPNGCICLYSDSESFEYVRDSLEKTLLSNLEQEDRLPFQGLPLVTLFLPEPHLEEQELLKLHEEGQNLSDSLQCAYIDISLEDDYYNRERFSTQLVNKALSLLLQSIQERSGVPNIYQANMDGMEPDIRVIMCLFCGDPYSVENVLAPLLGHHCCFMSGERSIMLETFLGSSKRKVEVIISSFHGANAFREELVHGFILVYSTKRKASLATLNAFSMNIPNLPIQIMAVTDIGGANAFFTNDLCHLLITEGNATADRLQAHFTTSNSSFQHKTAFYTPFFKEVWDKKPEIEQAFHLEEPAVDNNMGLEDDQILPSMGNNTYHLKLAASANDMLNSDIYDKQETEDGSFSPTFSHEQMTLGSASEESDTYSPLGNPHKGNSVSPHKLLQGFHVYPPPATPPEPAPPDHPPRHVLSNATNMLGSYTSLDEITCNSII